MPREFVKDPEAVLDYIVDWTNWLATGETISTSTWTVDSGVTEDSSTNTSTAATIWLSGGTAGTTYEATNHIVTSEGREDDRTIVIKVRNR